MLCSCLLSDPFLPFLRCDPCRPLRRTSIPSSSSSAGAHREWTHTFTIKSKSKHCSHSDVAKDWRKTIDPHQQVVDFTDLMKLIYNRQRPHEGCSGVLIVYNSPFLGSVLHHNTAWAKFVGNFQLLCGLKYHIFHVFCQVK